LIGTLDSPQPQVEIEARIVQTTRQFARTIGVQWGVNGRASNTIGNTTGLAFPNQGSITGRTGATQGPPAPEPQFDAAATAVNLGVTGASSAVGLALGGLPLGLAHHVKLRRPIERGQPVKWNDVAFDKADVAVRFRRQMEADFRPSSAAA